MRRLLTFAAASAALVATGAQAQTPGRVLSWPGKTAPAPAPMVSEPAPAPFIAYSNAAPAFTPRGENRYSPRTSAPRQMARMTIPAPVYAPPPAYVPPTYVPPPVFTAPQPAPFEAPYAAPAPRPSVRPQSPSSIFDASIPDRAFEPAPTPAAAAPIAAPVAAASPAPATAAPVPAPPPAAARAPSPNGPRFYSVHREFGEAPDRAPHPAVARGPTADPLPTGFFSPNAREEDDDTVEERPIERKAPAKPKRKSAKR